MQPDNSKGNSSVILRFCSTAHGQWLGVHASTLATVIRVFCTEERGSQCEEQTILKKYLKKIASHCEEQTIGKLWRPAVGLLATMGRHRNAFGVAAAGNYPIHRCLDNCKRNPPPMLLVTRKTSWKCSRWTRKIALLLLRNKKAWYCSHIPSRLWKSMIIKRAGKTLISSDTSSNLIQARRELGILAEGQALQQQ